MIFRDWRICFIDNFYKETFYSPAEESAASSTQAENSSYACLLHKQMCHTRKLNFCKNEVDKYML